MGMGDEILVVKRDVLFEQGDFQGFKEFKEKDYLKIILENFEYQIRSKELESNSYWQQPISYVWIINPKTKNVFLYKRSKTGNEGRLHNRFSGGVGGHIDKKTEEKSINPVLSAMIRELEEEVKIQKYPIPKVIGFLNDDSEPVGQVHFGVVGLAETTYNVSPAEDMAHGQFYTIVEVEKLFADSNNEIEGWTRASWPFIKDYLSKI